MAHLLSQYNSKCHLQLRPQAKSSYASELKRFGTERVRLGTRLGHLIIVSEPIWLRVTFGPLFVYSCMSTNCVLLCLACSISYIAF